MTGSFSSSSRFFADRDAIAFCFLPFLHLGQRGLELFPLPLELVHVLENVGQVHAGFAGRVDHVDKPYRSLARRYELRRRVLRRAFRQRWI